MPDAAAEAALLVLCEDLGLFRHYDGGPLSGLTLSAAGLQALLGEARLAERAALTVPAAPPQRQAGMAEGGRARRTGLPRALTSFLGREREVRDARGLLHAGRLLTITGAGGTGKTRLASAVAEEAQANFDDGAAFVDLAPLGEASMVLPAIASALGVEEAGGRPLGPVLTAYLADRQLLLVLDNFEHVAVAAPVVHELLLAAPQLTLLVTSRVALRLSGEVEYALPPLPVPDLVALPPVAELLSQPAVALFVQRTQAVKPGFRLTAENARVVAEVVARLDGLPLAIELAAAWSKLLPPHELLRRLGQRLLLLTGGARDLPARQQTLRDTIAWSVGLLNPDERRLFQRLAVFHGGCTLDTAEVVCSAGLDLDAISGIAALVDKSLLVQPETIDAGPRVRMLATIQEYAREMLAASGEGDEVARRHAEHFVGLLEQAYRERGTTGQRIWMPEHTNISAAFAWATEHDDAELCLRFLAVQRWLEIAAPVQGRRWAERLLASAPARERGELHAHALLFAGYMAWGQGDIRTQVEHLTECVPIWREIGRLNQLALAPSFLALGMAVMDECARARVQSEEALLTARSGNDPWIATVVVYNGGRVLATCGDDSAAIPVYGEALHYAEAAQDDFMVACVQTAHGASLCRLGDPAAAVALFEAALPVVRAYGDTRHVALVPCNLGYAALQLGDTARGHGYLVESLQLGLGYEDAMNTAGCVGGLGACAAQAGDMPRAARLFGAAHRLLTETGAARWPGDRLTHESWLSAVRAALGEAAFAREWAAGEALPRDATIVLAQSAHR